MGRREVVIDALLDTVPSDARYRVHGRGEIVVLELLEVRTEPEHWFATALKEAARRG